MLTLHTNKCNGSQNFAHFTEGDIRAEGFAWRSVTRSTGILGCGAHFSYLNSVIFLFWCKLRFEINRKIGHFILFYLDSFSVTEEYSSCSRHPCQNGGTCINGRTSFTCACRHPFTGDNCTIKLVEENALAPGKKNYMHLWMCSLS